MLLHCTPTVKISNLNLNDDWLGSVEVNCQREGNNEKIIKRCTCEGRTSIMILMIKWTVRRHASILTPRTQLGLQLPVLSLTLTFRYLKKGFLEILFTMINEEIALEQLFPLPPPSPPAHSSSIPQPSRGRWMQPSCILLLTFRLPSDWWMLPLPSPKVIYMNAIFQLYKLVSNWVVDDE